MRYVGYLLIVLAGMGMGFYQAHRLHGQVVFLRRTVRLLETLGQQLAYTPCPMEELWERLIALPGFSDCALLTATVSQLVDSDFATAFSEAVEGCYTAGRLTVTGRQLLLEFAAGCGRYDYVRQQEHIRHYCACLQDLQRELETESAMKGRLYRVMGASVGGGLALLLL